MRPRDGKAGGRGQGRERGPQGGGTSPAAGLGRGGGRGHSPRPHGNKVLQKVLWLQNHLRDCCCVWYMKASTVANGRNLKAEK